MNHLKLYEQFNNEDDPWGEERKPYRGGKIEIRDKVMLIDRNEAKIIQHEIGYYYYGQTVLDTGDIFVVKGIHPVLVHDRLVRGLNFNNNWSQDVLYNEKKFKKI